MPQMPLNTPVIDKDGKMTFLWMRHILALNDAVTGLQAPILALTDAVTGLQAPLPTYAGNAAAKAGGLTAGARYITPTGAMMVVY